MIIHKYFLTKMLKNSIDTNPKPQIILINYFKMIESIMQQHIVNTVAWKKEV